LFLAGGDVGTGGLCLDGCAGEQHDDAAQQARWDALHECISVVVDLAALLFAPAPAPAPAPMAMILVFELPLGQFFRDGDGVDFIMLEVVIGHKNF